jgi:hypothetical protein
MEGVLKMQLILTSEDLAAFSPATRGEILARMFGGEIDAPSAPVSTGARQAEYRGIDLTDVVDLSVRQVHRWMEAASDKTKLGLKVIAQRGPVVRAKHLTRAGIDNLPHFQSRTTIRTRTITGNREAYLLGWDDWYKVDEGEGRYAVIHRTHSSLRRSFELG